MAPTGMRIDRRAPELRSRDLGCSGQVEIRRGAGESERAARASLRGQIGKLERELSAIVAQGFPHISPPPDPANGDWLGGPRLLSLAELERLRDRLALRVGEAQQRAQERAELHERSYALLQRMKLEPGRYKFMRLRVADLGEGSCGVWEVRPRLGLIGMLAGWWELKLSSGCPLATGRAAARPAPKSTARRAYAADARSTNRSSSSRTSAVARGTYGSGSRPNAAGS